MNVIHSSTSAGCRQTKQCRQPHVDESSTLPTSAILFSTVCRVHSLVVSAPTVISQTLSVQFTSTNVTSMDHRNSEAVNRHYDPKPHRKLHQNANFFVLRNYDGRIKKCRGCKMLFKSATDLPKFVIAHRELYVYGGMKGTKRLLKATNNRYLNTKLAITTLVWEIRPPFLELVGGYRGRRV